MKGRWPDGESRCLKVGDLAAGVGKGLFAGAVGTAALTAPSTLEMRARGREHGTRGRRGKVLGVEPEDEAGKARFSTLVHWVYGTGWGAVRGLISAAGLRGTAATAAHFGAVWASVQVTLPALGAAPFWTWEAKEVGIDAFHHLVYAGTKGASCAPGSLGPTPAPQGFFGKDSR